MSADNRSASPSGNGPVGAQSHSHGHSHGHVHGPDCNHDHGDPYDPNLLMKRQPVFRTEPKVGRNDPCPCGSGKKYKKCHGQ